MTTQNQMNVEQRITSTIEGKAPFCADMIARWVFQATLGNQHIFKSLENCRFTFKSTDDMRFSATGQILTGPDFDIEITVKFIWTKKDSKLKAAITGI